MANIWDRLRNIAVETLENGANAVMPAENETVGKIESMARAGISGLARGLAADMKVPHCEARTRFSMGHMLKCGKEASKISDGIKYCDLCAPKWAKPIIVNISHYDKETNQ
jgi:hypothetical protein